MRAKVRPFSGNIVTTLPPVYRVALPRAKFFFPEVDTVVTTLDEDVTRLKRYQARMGGVSQLDHPFSVPLTLYVRSLYSAGQTNIARTLSGLVCATEKWILAHVPVGYYGSAVRAVLKNLSEYAYPRQFTDGPAWTLLIGLETAGGPAPHTDALVLADLKSWLSPVEGWDRQHATECVDHVFASTPSRLVGDTSMLGFREYCTDVLRWGTSGGAPKSVWHNHFPDAKNKWLWGFSKVMTQDGEWTGGDVYEASLAERQHAIVALKTEPSKTREIITTPLSSYLRQSYLLYRVGKLHLDSPAVNRNFLPAFEEREFFWYGCVDGKRFDHNVPKWFILYVIDCFGGKDGECRWVADEEIKHLNNLQIEWKGVMYPWHGGLLSGWRMTSIIGSLVSYVAVRRLDKTFPELALQYAVMGDDLMIASYLCGIEKKELVRIYEQCGLVANMRKTASGPVGEFLRRTYSPLGVLGGAGLALRALCYAMPWVRRYQHENPTELSTVWLTLYSRLLPHCTTVDVLSDFIADHIVHECMRNFPGPTEKHWRSWISTPVSAGGGGPLEWSDPERWTYLIDEKPQDYKHSLVLRFLGHFIPSTRKKQYKKIIITKKLDYNKLLLRLKDVNRQGAGIRFSLYIGKNVNKTKNLVEWYVNPALPATSIERMMGLRLPYGLRVAGKDQILSWILGIERECTGLTSVQVTPEYNYKLSSTVRNVAASCSSKSLLAPIREMNALITIYASASFAHRECVRGSW